jgi:hypothetical protein
MVRNKQEVGTAISGGIVGGVAGGIAIALVLAFLAFTSTGDVWPALKGAGYPFLGDRAAAPGFDLLAVLIGVASHFAVSIVWGVLFGLLFYGISRAATVIAGVAWGIVVWAGMYFVVLPAVGLGAMAASAPRALSLIQHMIFGAGVGVGFMAFQQPHTERRRFVTVADAREPAPV